MYVVFSVNVRKYTKTDMNIRPLSQETVVSGRKISLGQRKWEFAVVVVILLDLVAFVLTIYRSQVALPNYAIMDLILLFILAVVLMASIVKVEKRGV